MASADIPLGWLADLFQKARRPVAPLKLGGYIRGALAPATAQVLFSSRYGGFFQPKRADEAMTQPLQTPKSRKRSFSDDLFGPELPTGCTFHPKSLGLRTQMALLAAIQEIAHAAPLTKVLTKTGGYTSAAITNCGHAGWWSDAKGYRYETRNPANGMPWPAMPDIFLRAVSACVANTPWPNFAPDACLINFYEPGAKMGLHQDRDEKDFTQPIVTVCLGGDADFQVGGPKRSDKTTSIIVRSGDVMIMGGESRLYFHGVRKIYSDTSPIPEIKGRYSLTFRKAL